MRLSGSVGILLAILITACHAASSSQPASPNSPPAASSLPVSSPTSNDAASLQQEAVQVVRDYYRAITRRDYEQAYLSWDGEGTASQQSFEQFKQGFANTASAAVETGEPGQLDGAAGSSYIEIPVTVTSVTRSGTPQRFSGSYVLRRINDVPGSTLEQQQWHLYSADIQQDN